MSLPAITEPPTQSATPAPNGVEAPAGEAVESQSVTGEEQAEASEEEHEEKAKTSKKLVRDAKFADIRRAERMARENAAATERERQERIRIERELQQEREENKRFRESLKRQHAVALTRDLGMSREEVLAQQADEATVPTHLRHDIEELRSGIAEEREAWRKEVEAIRQERRAEKFEAGVQSDVDKSIALIDSDTHPHFSALPESVQRARIDAAVRRAVADGSAASLTRASLLEMLDDEVAELVTHIRGAGRSNGKAPEVSERRVATEQPKAPTRAVSARGKSAPAASGPMTDVERREQAIQNLRKKRLEREQAELTKVGQR